MAKKEKDIEDTEKTSTIDKTLELALAKIKKEFGSGAIMALSDKAMDVEAISTGSIRLDEMTGIGGIPLGRITEIFGQESSGKTTLAQQIVLSAMKKFPDKKIAFVDTEHALNKDYLEDMGIDLSRILVAQPDCGEDALNIIDALLDSNSCPLIILDSVAASTPKAEVEGSFDDQNIGLQARLFGKMARKFAAKVNNTNTALVLINQERMDVRTGRNITPAGKAIKFSASLRIQLAKVGQLKDKETIVGITIKAKAVKNKLAPPFRSCDFDLYFGIGILKQAELLSLGVDTGLIDKGSVGNYTIFENKVRGEQNAIRFLIDNPEISSDLEQKIAHIMEGVKNNEVDA